MPLVHLVDDDDAVLLEQGVGAELAQEEALGQEENFGPLAAVGVEADLVRHLRAVLVEGLGGHARTERHGRNAPRLRARHAVEARLHQILRHLRRLAAPRIACNQHHLLAPHSRNDLVAEGIDRQRALVLAHLADLGNALALAEVLEEQERPLCLLDLFVAQHARRRHVGPRRHHSEIDPVALVVLLGHLAAKFSELPVKVRARQRAGGAAAPARPRTRAVCRRWVFARGRAGCLCPLQLLFAKLGVPLEKLAKLAVQAGAGPDKGAGGEQQRVQLREPVTAEQCVPLHRRGELPLQLSLLPGRRRLPAAVLPRARALALPPRAAPTPVPLVPAAGPVSVPGRRPAAAVPPRVCPPRRRRVRLRLPAAVPGPVPAVVCLLPGMPAPVPAVHAPAGCTVTAGWGGGSMALQQRLPQPRLLVHSLRHAATPPLKRLNYVYKKGP